MERTYRWKALEGSGLEVLRLRVKEEVSADGMLIGDRSGEPYALRYRILCDTRWGVRELHVEGLDGTRLTLLGDGAGRWTDGAGRRIDALDGAIDIDLAASPFTNTLPLRRLGKTLHQRTIITVVYVAVPDLSVSLARQAYTRIGSHRARFEGLDSDFQAELDVDEDDLVLRYPGLFERLGTQELNDPASSI